MKLNYKRTLLVGMAFFLISAFWQAYDAIVPLILTNHFGLPQSASGAVMSIDNVLAVAYDDECEENRTEAMNTLISLGITEEEAELLPKELSGGMKQRVSFARAILRNRPILLLDEPMKELNEELCRTVKKILTRESEKRLVIMVSHNPEDREIENVNLIELKDAEA